MQDQVFPMLNVKYVYMCRDVVSRSSQVCIISSDMVHEMSTHFFKNMWSLFLRYDHYFKTQCAIFVTLNFDIQGQIVWRIDYDSTCAKYITLTFTNVVNGLIFSFG